jgi:CoA:oxalate CoA-transferase
MARPLDGMKVVDLTHVMAGPFCTHILGLLGASVVKVEKPGEGDVFRHYDRRPEFAAMAPSFQAVNVGKKSIAVDLKHEQGVAIVLDLMRDADVVVENFRPGVLDRLGLGYADCKAIRPDIVYCSLTGYGQTGPLRDYPAYDHIMQAVGGVMSLTGEPSGEPQKAGFPLIDTFTGYAGALAIVSAILKRERFGGGERIDMAMLDASLLLLISMVGPYLIAGDEPQRAGNRGFNASPTATTFQTADGPLLLGANTQRQFEGVCQVLGRPDIAADPRFATQDSRIDHESALLVELRPLFRTQSAEAWETLFNAAGVPAGAVRTVPGIVGHPHLASRSLTTGFKLPRTDRMAATLNLGFDLGRPEGGLTDPPPTIGQHTDEILERLSYDKERVAALRASGVVG